VAGYPAIFHELLETRDDPLGIASVIARGLTDIRGASMRFALRDGVGTMVVSFALTPGADHAWASLFLESAPPEMEARIAWRLDETDPEHPEVHLIMVDPGARLPSSGVVTFSEPEELEGWHVISDDVAIRTLGLPMMLPPGLGTFEIRSFPHDAYHVVGLSTGDVPDWEINAEGFVPAATPDTSFFCEEHRVMALSVLLSRFGRTSPAMQRSLVEGFVADELSLTASRCGEDGAAVEAAWGETIEAIGAPSEDEAAE